MSEMAKKAATGRARNVSASVAKVISDRIIDGTYRPGERLIEAELAKDLGVGRGSVREALRRLESNCYIAFEPNRGAMVAQPTPEEITAMLRVRTVIAGLGGRAAAERIDRPGNRERAESLLERLRVERDEQSPAEHRANNGFFHRVLNEISNIRYVTELIDQVNIPVLYEIYFRDLTREQWLKNLDDHFDLARAVLQADADAAEHYAKRHMSRMIEIAKAIGEKLVKPQ
jgi:DNA-binding GntR family transcriptional regulator